MYPFMKAKCCAWDGSGGEDGRILIGYMRAIQGDENDLLARKQTLQNARCE